MMAFREGLPGYDPPGGLSDARFYRDGSLAVGSDIFGANRRHGDPVFCASRCGGRALATQW